MNLYHKILPRYISSLLIMLIISNCNGQKKTIKTDINNDKNINTSVELDKEYNFKMILKNNTDSVFFYYKCFSVQEIELNNNLLFQFTITDKRNNFIRNLNKNKINYFTTKCLTLINPNDSDTLQFNLKNYFSNIQSIDFVKENLSINIMYKILVNNKLFTKKKDFLIYSLPSVQEMH